jgi:hypothetical protein
LGEIEVCELQEVVADEEKKGAEEKLRGDHSSKELEEA